MAASLRRLDFEVEAQYATVPENSPAVSHIVYSQRMKDLQDGESERAPE
jgi:hypothetical protein